MAVRVFCDNPRALLSKIRSAIEDGSIDTWSIDSDGDFTHAPDQWKFKAWLSPRVLDDRIIFNILGQKSKKMSRTVYAVYHGRFIEMLLAHFDRDIKRARGTGSGEAPSER
jgi:hypothetical protein